MNFIIIYLIIIIIVSIIYCLFKLSIKQPHISNLRCILIGILTIGLIYLVMNNCSILPGIIVFTIVIILCKFGDK